MAFELKMTEQQAVDGLRESYGTEFTTADVKAFCAMNDIGYSTVTKKIQKYKVSKGKWNLEITPQAVESIEKSFNAPAVIPSQEQNIVPVKDNTFVPFGSFKMLRVLLSLNSFTLPSLLVYQEMVKPLV